MSHNRPARAASRSEHVQADPGPLLADALAMPARRSGRTCRAATGRPPGRMPVVCAAERSPYLPEQRHTAPEAVARLRPYLRGLLGERLAGPHLVHAAGPTLSMRTTGSVVIDGRSRRCAGRLRWPATARRRLGCCTLVLHRHADSVAARSRARPPTGREDRVGAGPVSARESIECDCRTVGRVSDAGTRDSPDDATGAVTQPSGSRAR